MQIEWVQREHPISCFGVCTEVNDRDAHPEYGGYLMTKGLALLTSNLICNEIITSMTQPSNVRARVLLPLVPPAVRCESSATATRTKLSIMAPHSWTSGTVLRPPRTMGQMYVEFVPPVRKVVRYAPVASDRAGPRYLNLERARLRRRRRKPSNAASYIVASTSLIASMLFGAAIALEC